MKTDNYPGIKWILPKPVKDEKIDNININGILQKVLVRRGIDLNSELDEYISPSELPNPEDHFNGLSKATERIIDACGKQEQIAICGDYDADGITSTVLLVELLSTLGARVKAYIPSRQHEGYGLNLSMIQQINNQEIRLIITVDNGISAFEAIQEAKALGIDLIITDHHKIPDKQLDYFSLLHPDRTPLNSPYKYLAGVGIAYLLGKNICNKLKYDINNTTANALFCIGTIADMAPLKGANRKWLKECLPKINQTSNKGIKSILKRLSIDKTDITSEDIGYKIAPLINAVGRIGEPNLIIDLFTNKSTFSVEKLSKECFAMNNERKRITLLIQHEALEKALREFKDDRKFLVLKKREWHPGIIGIVAARIVDRFNLPTAILAEANDGNYRGSIRSNNRLNVSQALEECSELLLSFGGHSAAAGFSIKEENIHLLRDRLNRIAIREFKKIDLYKLIKPDAYVSFKEINEDFYNELCSLGPFGVLNPTPIFWTRRCKVINCYMIKGNHLKMTLNDGSFSIDAIKWNGPSKIEKNDLIDVAYYLEMNRWKNNKKFQINIIDMKKYNDVIDLQLHNRTYKCQVTDSKGILITNSKGESITSDFSSTSENLNTKQRIFAKKILSFAEIALGKAA